MIIDQCYMADHIDAKSKIDRKKGKEIVFLIVLKIGIQQLNHYRAIYGPQVFLGFIQA